MSDPFEEFTPGLNSPPSRAQSVTPSDSMDLPIFSRAINVAMAGTIRVTTIAGDDTTVTVAAGITFPIRVRRVWETGTSASGIVALS